MQTIDRKFFSIAFSLMVFFCAAIIQAQETGLKKPLLGSRQLVVVITKSWDSVDGYLQRYERMRTTGTWKAVGERTALVVGTKGLAWGRGLHGVALGEGPVKKEGDGKSPAGAFHLSAVYGYAPVDSVFPMAMPYIPVDSTTICVDDVNSVYYNSIVNKSNVTSVDWKHGERMGKVGHDYHWGVVVEQNVDPRVPGAGSCIFLHIWSPPSKGTEGCTAFDEAKLVELIKWLKPSERPVLVQLTEEEYRRLQPQWSLPALEAR